MFHDTPLLIVQDARTLQDVALRLSHARVIAVDTEADSMYHYQEKVCLIQFTDALGDIIVDPLAVPDLSPLKPIFEDRSIVKVFHGADYDIVSLRRDFGFRTRNLFDTLIAAQFLGVKGLGYADLVRRWFGQELDKQFQRHDWSQRPLLPEHLDYARGDTHWLPALRQILLRKLRVSGRHRQAAEECRVLERRRWKRVPFNPDDWSRVKGSNALDDDGRRVFRRLFIYRDEQARKLDRPPYKVIANDVLLRIASSRPRTTAALERLLPSMRGLRRRHEAALLRCVLKGLDDDLPVPAKVVEEPEETGGPPTRLHGRAADRVLEALKAWRNGLPGEENPAVTVASNHTLKQIARVRPVDLDELAAIPDVRRWQVTWWGDALLAQLDKVAPVSSLPKPAPKRRRR